MGSINIHNYERFLLDYLEGSLEPGLLPGMETFLSAHPGLLEEALESLEVRLVVEEVQYPGLEDLYRQDLPLESEYGPLFASAADGTLDALQEEQVRGMLEAYPALQSEYQAYLRTRLSPDLGVTYPSLATLKKPVPLLAAPARLWLRVAAVALLLLISGWAFFGIRKMNDGPSTNQVAMSSGSDRPASTSPAESTPMETLSEPSSTTASQPSSVTPTPPAMSRSRGNGASRPEHAESQEPRPLPVPLLASLTMQSDMLRAEVAADHGPFAMQQYYGSPGMAWVSDDPILAAQSGDPRVWNTGRLGEWLKGRNREKTAPLPVPGNGSAALWRVADAGVSAINLLTNNAIALNRDTDE
ncbi:MAG TPA: hypothetical protein P5248_05615, partial [Bacteroidales bacterium]|nr:hypothetical protein [Bacteroidales bacterium]